MSIKPLHLMFHTMSHYATTFPSKDLAGGRTAVYTLANQDVPCFLQPVKNLNQTKFKKEQEERDADLYLCDEEVYSEIAIADLIECEGQTYRIAGTHPPMMGLELYRLSLLEDITGIIL